MMLENYVDQLPEDKRRLYELSARLWDDFELLKVEYGSDTLLSLNVTESELDLVRDAYGDYLKGEKSTGFLCILDQWGHAGVHFLVATLFARYSRSSEPHFWHALEQWTCGNKLPKRDVKNYEAHREFSKTHNLFLYQAKNARHQHMYVSSIQTHAIIVPEHAHKILEGLKYLVFSYPYFIDNDELEEVLSWFIDQSARAIPDEDALDEQASPQTEGGRLDISGRISVFLRLPRAFRRACHVNPVQVLNELKPLYRTVEQLLLSLEIHYEGLEDIEEVPWQLEHVIAQYSRRLVDEESRNISTFVRRSHGRRRYKSPDFFLDVETYALQVLIPGQRIVSDEEEPEIHAIIRCDDAVLDIELRLIDIGSWFLSEEAYVTVPSFFSAATVEITDSGVPIRSFRLQRRYIPFNGEGEIISRPTQASEGALIVVPDDVSFMADDAELVTAKSKEGYCVYSVLIEESSYFIIGDLMVSPFATPVPAVRVHQDKRMIGVSIQTDTDVKLSVYKEFPAISFRVPSGQPGVHAYHLVVNGHRIPYRVVHESIVGDESGDAVYTIIPDDHASSSIPPHTELHVKIVNQPIFEERLVVLPEFDYRFTKDYYLDERDVCVEYLWFSGCNALFTRNYDFRTPQRTSRFHLQIGERECKLQLPAPVISWSFDNGESVPEHVLQASLASRKIRVISAFERCVLVVTPTDAGQPPQRIRAENARDGTKLFDLESIKNFQNTTSELHVEFGDRRKGVVWSELITRIYPKFTLLSSPTWIYEDGNSPFRKLHSHQGQYVILESVGDPAGTYVASLISSKDETEVIKFNVPGNNDSRHHLFVSDQVIEDGEYRLTIAKSFRVMGHAAAGVREVFRSEPFVLRSGQLVSPGDLRGLTLEGRSAIMRIINTLDVPEDRYTDINNFFLYVRDVEPDGPERCFRADGFFHLGERIQYHTKFNPYKIAVESCSGNSYILHIRDCDGNKLSVDDHGHINKLGALKSIRISRIVCEIVDTERER